ncbi:hypothetical protein PR202_ga06664 [Eleusine coracana subsp. coracana]|uniref:Uncharacterized protein n=1 Tax=Eleusine coracana subsp. coracana TaxID=191504 RepID=A0AAV5BY02_ELECO|nr:hypothetical protein PR202_ga06664 [Eleusine coracana subsp. coracana]
MGVMCEAEAGKKTMIRVREFDVGRDLRAVGELERRCQVGMSGDQNPDDNGGARKKKTKKGMSLYVEQIGDPFSRIRHAPDHVILVAEYGDEEEIVGVIKACTRMVSRVKTKKKQGFSSSKQQCQFVKVPRDRLGAGPPRRVVERVPRRVARHHGHHRVERGVAGALHRPALRLRSLPPPRVPGPPGPPPPGPPPAGPPRPPPPPPLAAAAYAALLPPAAAEFQPADLPALLAHKLTLGTYLAIERSGPGPACGPPSYALLSVWDATRSLRLRVGGAPTLLRASLAAARALDRNAPWLQLPSVPDIFRPFGTYLLYGLRMSGPEGPALLRTLCRHAHNVARKNPACAVVAADLGPDDPAAAAVPHWPRFSSDEDVWCIKKLRANGGNASDDDDDWTTASPAGVLFVDPREF